MTSEDTGTSALQSAAETRAHRRPAQALGRRRCRMETNHPQEEAAHPPSENRQRGKKSTKHRKRAERPFRPEGQPPRCTALGEEKGQKSTRCLWILGGKRDSANEKNVRPCRRKKNQTPRTLRKPPTGGQGTLSCQQDRESTKLSGLFQTKQKRVPLNLESCRTRQWCFIGRGTQ